MSKLEKLIQQYCPDGVEYVRLGDVLSVNRGKRLTKTQLSDDGKYFVYHGSKDTPLGKYSRFNVKGNTTIVVNTGGIGGVKFCADDFWCSDGSFWIGHSALLNDKYVYYYLSPKESYFASQKRVGGVPTIDRSTVENVEIPVPPLPVQEEIVRVLDTFTELQAELQAELQKRKQQYNYYLDNLLNFKNINRGGQEIKWMKLSDIGTFYSGLSGKTKDDFHDGNAKFISYVNIFNNPSLITDVKDRVRILEGEKQNTIQYGDLLFTGSSETPDECGMCSVLTHHTEEKLYLNSFCFGFRFNDLSEINPEFMKFLFRSSAIRKLICKTANGVTRFNISKKEFAKIVIPIPSLKEQDHIASVLDKFYFLVGDLTSGLPAEIEKRRQQYEFYRDKLLTFKRKEA